MAFRHAVTPAWAALRFTPVISGGMVTVTLGEFVDVTGGVVFDVRSDDDDVTLDPAEAVRLLDCVVIGGVVEMPDGRSVVVTVDPAPADCVALVVSAESVTVEAARPDVVDLLAGVGSLSDETPGALVGGGVVIELHAASESVTAAASPAR